MVDAENLLAHRRTRLAATIASRKDLEREIAAAQSRIQSREAQIAGLAPAERSEEILLLAAKDIAASEAHLDAVRRRHTEVAQRISKEELTLRSLLAEIREHRRELRILETQLGSNGGTVACRYRETVAAQLATLRETHAGITGAVSASDQAEAGMEEAIERVDGDPLDRELSALGRDGESQRVDSVLARLRSIDSAA